jgi:hypothetical protein
MQTPYIPCHNSRVHFPLLSDHTVLRDIVQLLIPLLIKQKYIWKSGNRKCAGNME